MAKQILVWPCSADLAYHSILETFVTSQVPDEPRSLYADECTPIADKAECMAHVDFERALQVGDQTLQVQLKLIVVLDINDESLCAIMDRSRGALNVHYASVDAIVILALPGEENAACLAVTSWMIAKQLNSCPTYIVCVDDPSLAIGKHFQKTVIAAFANYGKDWHLKSISKNPSVEETETLFQQILGPNTNAAAAAAASASPGRASSQKQGRRGGCVLL
eukprot:TRINITY_DN11928_c0_g1_i1.p1 TRINITY_DN11928_c0_g1~~TRINITY_DN11928_c0_g1_i1.p1  ORF type:complete len:221 (+),score=43.47 TRINITY_DN11928_c0_g1_i1:25-687(+)